LLTGGQGLFEAAEKLGITKNTARTHMRNIYSKVGTHRQADLIRLFGQFSMF
jgi:DNA-binding CsgD family transcriptional regulator